MIILSNAFSLQMLKEDVIIKTTTISLDDARTILLNNFNVIDFNSSSVVSAIGHADTASVVSNLLGSTGITISGPICNRINVTLSDKDLLVVAQYSGPRLAEGATTLPEGAKIVFKTVEILKDTWKAECLMDDGSLEDVIDLKGLMTYRQAIESVPSNCRCDSVYVY